MRLSVKSCSLSRLTWSVYTHRKTASPTSSSSELQSKKNILYLHIYTKISLYISITTDIVVHLSVHNSGSYHRFPNKLHNQSITIFIISPFPLLILPWQTIFLTKCINVCKGWNPPVVTTRCQNKTMCSYGPGSKVYWHITVLFLNERKVCH